MSAARRKKRAAYRVPDLDGDRGRSPREWRLERRARRVCVASHWGNLAPALRVKPFRKPYDQAARVAFVTARCRYCRRQVAGAAVVTDLEATALPDDELRALLAARLANAARVALGLVATRRKRARWQAEVRGGDVGADGWPKL